MGLVDFILNLAAILLWLSWCSIRFDALVKTTPATLVGTVRRAEPRRLKGWQFLAALAALLLLRTFLYYRQTAPTADWTPKLNLFFVVLPFPNDTFQSVLLYSVLSFTRIFIICYFWGLALVIINRSIAETDPLQKMLHLHLGPVVRWPRLLQLLLPLLLIIGLWMALHPWLAHLGITSHVHSNTRLAEQGLLLGVALFLTLQYLLPLFLLVHLAASYVYWGRSPWWDFIGATARNLLAPLRWLPLRMARFDFAPLVGVMLFLFVLHWLPNLILGKWAGHHASLWSR
ncbi:MAG: hypothetical protein WCQ21_30845 [Verrucomicrobiota bacterium]